jgi:pectinesterase
MSLLPQKSRINSIAATYGSIAAENRQTAASNTGFSFVSCTVTGTGYIYLGRAWGPYSRIIFAKTSLPSIIRPEGWNDFGVPAYQK